MSFMLNHAFLKKLTVLYVEDDVEVRSSLERTLSKVLKELYVTKDGQEALTLYQKLKAEGRPLDAIISDIHMPNLDGIRFLEEVRQVEEELPFIFTTAYSETDYLLHAIKLNATDYILKPIDITVLVEKLCKVCYVKYQNKTILRQKVELERYLKAIDEVAIISKTDLSGNITFVNQIFCDIAQYTKEELLGKPHNIIRHPDMPSEAFKVLWETIQAGHSWQGKVKNRAKDGSAYYVNATIIPLYDETGETIVEYMGIRFLTTDDELEKREFKKRVLQNIQENKKRRIEDAHHIKLLEQKLKGYENVELIEDALHKERKKTSQLNSQLKTYEDEMKGIRTKNETLIGTANDKVRKAGRIAIELKGLNDKLSLETEELKGELQKRTEVLKELQLRVVDQSKVIKDLREVIEHREDQLQSMTQ